MLKMIANRRDRRSILRNEPSFAVVSLIFDLFLFLRMIRRTIFGIGVGRGVGTRWLYVQGKCTCVEELTFSIFVRHHAFQHLPSTWVKFTKTGSPVRLARTPDEVLSCLVHYLGGQHSHDSHLHLTTMFGNPVYLRWWAATSTLIPGSWQIDKAEGNQLILTGDS